MPTSEQEEENFVRAKHIEEAHPPTTETNDCLPSTPPARPSYAAGLLKKKTIALLFSACGSNHRSTTMRRRATERRVRPASTGDIFQANGIHQTKTQKLKLIAIQGGDPHPAQRRTPPERRGEGPSGLDLEEQEGPMATYTRTVSSLTPKTRLSLDAPHLLPHRTLKRKPPYPGAYPPPSLSPSPDLLPCICLP